MTAAKPITRQAEAPAETPPVRYEADPYSWGLEQAALLRAGRLGAIDVANIAEEMDDVAGAQYDKLESALRLILMHMLKWDHQPGRRTRSWTTTIGAQRGIVEKVMRKNPGLKSRLEEAKGDAFAAARFDASGETDLDLAVFPLSLPYSWDEIMTRDHPWPPDDHAPPRRGPRGRQA